MRGKRNFEMQTCVLEPKRTTRFSDKVCTDRAMILLTNLGYGRRRSKAHLKVSD